ncbi:FtsX-like permease family protein, partial [Salmonella sp. SAL4355]|uniref:FtsX-like permease family protein n=1 Tax=Salmonella sp. SAL4355 TaxID=3159876 RepID=UPI003979A07A
MTQQRRDIGTRMLMGAEPRQIVSLFLVRTAVVVAVGTVLGVAGALGVGALLRPLLVQTYAYEPSAIIGGSALLLTVAVLA